MPQKNQNIGKSNESGGRKSKTRIKTSGTGEMKPCESVENQSRWGKQGECLLVFCSDLPSMWIWPRNKGSIWRFGRGGEVEPLLSAGPVRLSMTAADNGAPTPDGVWPGHGGHSPADPSQYTGTRRASLPAPRSVQRPRRSRSGLATGRGGGDRDIEGHPVGATAGEGDPVCPDFLRRRGGGPSFGKKSDSTGTNQSRPGGKSTCWKNSGNPKCGTIWTVLSSFFPAQLMLVLIPPPPPRTCHQQFQSGEAIKMGSK